jgi:hypothetical protein
MATTIILTTEHAASSYGVPVLVIEGEAYGPADMTPEGTTAEEAVLRLTRAFLGSLGDAGTRSNTLRIRLTEAERAGLDEAAAAAGQSRSEYARRRIFE